MKRFLKRLMEISDCYPGYLLTPPDYGIANHFYPDFSVPALGSLQIMVFLVAGEGQACGVERVDMLQK